MSTEEKPELPEGGWVSTAIRIFPENYRPGLIILAVLTGGLVFASESLTCASAHARDYVESHAQAAVQLQLEDLKQRTGTVEQHVLDHTASIIALQTKLTETHDAVIRIETKLDSAIEQHDQRGGHER